MGGKRFDQYRITPDEAGATDYKNLPNDPHETDRGNKAVKGPTAAKGTQPIPPAVLEPGTELAREEELARERHVRAKARKARGSKKRLPSDRKPR